MKFALAFFYVLVGFFVLLLVLSWAIGGGHPALLVVALGLLLALLLLTVSRQARQTDSPAKHSVAPPIVDTSQAPRVLLAIGLSSYVMAAYTVVDPQVGPFSGRWAWLLNTLHSTLGWLALPVAFFLAGSVLTCLAIAISKRSN